MRCNFYPCRLLTLACLAAAILAGCATAPLATLAGGETGRVHFQTLTLPTTQILTLTKDGTPTVVSGDLSFPSRATGRVPAVILVHGAAGVTSNLYDWAGELNRVGIAAFVLDGFSGRGITEIRTGRASVNIGSLVTDAYRALSLLATHPRIEPSHIALIGFSYGGAVVLWARQIRFQKLWMSENRQFAAFLALYPAGCNMRFLNEEQVSDRPLRIFHGTADDQTIIEPCREFIERMRRAGKDVYLVEYANAYHGFDAPNLPSSRFEPEVISSRNCTYRLMYQASEA